MHGYHDGKRYRYDHLAANSQKESTWKASIEYSRDSSELAIQICKFMNFKTLRRLHKVLRQKSVSLTSSNAERSISRPILCKCAAETKFHQAGDTGQLN